MQGFARVSEGLKNCEGLRGFARVKLCKLMRGLANCRQSRRKNSKIRSHSIKLADSNPNPSSPNPSSLNLAAQTLAAQTLAAQTLAAKPYHCELVFVHTPENWLLTAQTLAAQTLAAQTLANPRFWFSIFSISQAS